MADTKKDDKPTTGSGSTSAPSSAGSGSSASSASSTPQMTSAPPDPPTPPASSGKKKGAVILRMVKGAEIPGGHAKCWPFKIGPDALEGLSGPLRLDDTGVEVSKADADLLTSEAAKPAVGGRVFEIVEA